MWSPTASAANSRLRVVAPYYGWGQAGVPTGNIGYYGDGCDIALFVAPLNEAPVASCQSISVSLDENGEASIAAGDIDDGSYDEDGEIIQFKGKGYSRLMMAIMI